MSNLDTEKMSLQSSRRYSSSVPIGQRILILEFRDRNDRDIDIDDEMIMISTSMNRIKVSILEVATRL